MCKGSKSCVLLGSDPGTWSKAAPLLPPEWFDAQAVRFGQAVRHAADGDTAGAVAMLRTLRSDEMRAWFDEHGQVSGRRRRSVLRQPTPSTGPSSLDPLRSPRRFEVAVYQRDFHQCRYCGLKIIPKEVLYAFEKIVGTLEFRTRGTNAEQHGVIHAFKAVVDHVEPYKRGGRTDFNNLVTACPGCNYGKEAFTLEELGLDNPRDRVPVESDWDGLTSLLPALSARANVTQ